MLGFGREFWIGQVSIFSSHHVEIFRDPERVIGHRKVIPVGYDHLLDVAEVLGKLRVEAERIVLVAVDRESWFSEYVEQSAPSTGFGPADLPWSVGAAR